MHTLRLLPIVCGLQGESLTAAYEAVAPLDIGAFLFNCCVPESIEQVMASTVAVIVTVAVALYS